MKEGVIEPPLLRWLELVSDPGSLSIVTRSGAKGTLLGNVHEGRVAVAELVLSGVSALQLRSGVDSILLAFHRNGNLNGSINRQAICRVHGTLMGVAMPLEQLELSIESPGASLVLMQVSHTLMDLATGLHQGRSISEALLRGAVRGFELALVPMLEGLIRGEKQRTDTSATRLLALQRLEVSVVSLIVRLMPNGTTEPEQQEAGAALGWVEAAETLMRKRMQERLNLRIIAEGCGCSERTLQLAFQKQLKLSPMQRLRELRLDAMQRELAQGASVRSACEAAGLAASGRTAMHYQERFGQRPVERRQRAHQRLGTTAAVADSSVQKMA